MNGKYQNKIKRRGESVKEKTREEGKEQPVKRGRKKKDKEERAKECVEGRKRRGEDTNEKKEKQSLLQKEYGPVRLILSVIGC